YAVKNFSSGGIFLVTLFFAVEKRVTGVKGFKSTVINRTVTIVVMGAQHKAQLYSV
ncbi:MAG: hypothetical protein ACJASL_003944, partial [Paraglaciecola sp.]